MSAETLLRALIVDDERLGRLRLCSLLANDPRIEVVAQADSVESAAIAMERVSPDVVFLDVQMPGEDGFGLFERTSVRAYVVFVTAHDKYAVRAFEHQALDYLLKPILLDRLSQTLARLVRAQRSQVHALRPQTICLRTGTRSRITTSTDIAYINAADDYTEVYLADGSNHLVRVSMSAWEERLGGDGFIRVHRSTLVNVNALIAVDKTRGVATLRMGEVTASVCVSRRKLSEIMRVFEGVSRL